MLKIPGNIIATMGSCYPFSRHLRMESQSPAGRGAVILEGESLREYVPRLSLLLPSISCFLPVFSLDPNPEGNGSAVFQSQPPAVQRQRRAKILGAGKDTGESHCEEAAHGLNVYGSVHAQISVSEFILCPQALWTTQVQHLPHLHKETYP